MRRASLAGLLVLPCLVASLAACSSPAGPCDGVDCSFFGTCGRLSSGQEGYCLCRLGAHPTAGGLDCAPNDFVDPCLGVDCSDAGYCFSVSGFPICECDPGTRRDGTGLYCLPDGSVPADAGSEVGDGADDAGADEGAGGWWLDEQVREPGLTKLDIVLLVDNSGSMAQEQEALALQFPGLLGELLDPPDSDGDTRPDHAPIEDLNLGVISSDMGTAGFRVTTCVWADVGDDGCMRHHPVALPCGYHSYPTWLARNPENADTYPVERMIEDFGCLATLGTTGCGFEQQLKAMRGALTADLAPGACNAGFLRNDSLLALIWLTDEEDCSVRPDHPEMFDPDREELGHLNVRCFLNAELLEPVSDYAAAFAALRPTGAANVVLAMIVGVPPDEPRCTGTGDSLGACLGLPAMTARIDPASTADMVPSCRTEMGLAYPPRRFVELARLWGSDAYVDSICKSDWSAIFRTLAGRVVAGMGEDRVCLDRAPSFDGARCVAQCWLIETLDDGRECPADPSCPQAWCPAAEPETLDRLLPCTDPSTGALCLPVKRDLGTTRDGGYERRRCLVRQVPRDPLAYRCGGPLGDGWYFVPAAWSDEGCAELVFARSGALPLLARGSSAVFRCPR
ncbi:MAG: hypothetical protein HY907_17660 [Deltaproteobacteria bacterium]|nr:hypothetical protein [Deltaproteobacteria bacterium]